MTSTFITADAVGPIGLTDENEVFLLPGVNITSPGNAFQIFNVQGEVKGTYELSIAGNVLSNNDFFNTAFLANSDAQGEIFVNFSAGATVFAGGDLFELSALDPQITNAELHVTNAGFINVTSAAVDASGFDEVVFVNSGTLMQTSAPTGFGQDLFDNLGFGDATIVNHGLIQSAPVLDVVSHTLASNRSLDVVNTGTIIAGSGVAFNVNGGSAEGFNLTNSGSIFGDIDSFSKLVFTNSGGLVGNILTSNSVDEIENTGEINGDITTFGDNDIFINAGIITGGVNLGTEDDTFQTAGNGFATDVILGQAGNDTLLGGTFDDTLDGGENDDLLRGKGGDDDLMGGTGNDSLYGGNGNDSLVGFGGDDVVRGGAGNDTLSGGGNKDLLIGGTGNDTMDGGAGNDTLRGGAGDDTLAGQNGSDEMSGGSGADVFLFTNVSHSAVGSRDDILDFRKEQDKIDIDGLSNDTFVFLGNGAFTGLGGAEVRVTSNGAGNSVVRIDADGDGTADSEINVLGVTGLEAADFIL